MYSYLSKIKTNQTPAFNAYVIISVLQMFNLGTIGVWLNYFLSIDFNRNSAVYIGLFSIGILYILNYFILYARRKIIFEKYKDLITDRKKRGQIYFWLYIVLTFFIFFVSVANLVTPEY
jgi:hypothetical protein